MTRSDRFRLRLCVALIAASCAGGLAFGYAVSNGIAGVYFATFLMELAFGVVWWIDKRSEDREWRERYRRSGGSKWSRS